MARSWIITCLLFISLAAITRGQYFDLLQGIQQLFQPYQHNRPNYQSYDDVARQTNRQTNKQQSRTKKPDDRRNEQRKKKPTTSEFDFLFLTTPKPSRKTTKTPKTVVNNRNGSKHRNYNTDFFPFNFDTTIKPSRKSTSNNYNIGTTRSTTEKTVVSKNVSPAFNNRHVDDRKGEKYVVSSTYDLNNYWSTTNRGTVGLGDNGFVGTNNKGTANNNNYKTPNSENYSTQNPNKGINNDDNRFVGDNNRGNQYNRPVTSSRNDYYSTQNPNKGINNDDNRFVGDNNRGNQYNRPVTSSRNDYYSTQNPNKGINNNDNSFVGDNHRGNQNDEPVTDSRNVNVAMFNTDVIPSDRKVVNTPIRVPNKDFNNRLLDDRYVVTTHSPLLHRPGVRPVAGLERPPITNRPEIAFPSPVPGGYDIQTPEWLIGPDEEEMTSLQKRRYVDLAETMCERYKALNVRKVVALPLVPSPSPVEVNVTSCPRITVPLIIGGTVVDIKDFPHMALVGWISTRNYGYSWKCGGTLISDQFVLTAAHCVYQNKDSDAVNGPPQAVQLGSTYLDDPGALVVKISAVIRHPKYKTRRSYHDVALIRLVKKITFSEVIRPACIGVAPPPPNNVIVTGWGRTEFGGDHSTELRSVSLPVWDMRECREVWGTSLKLPNGPTPESHVCAGDRSGKKDTCQGDSGGPAQIQDGCVWRVVAVTSHGRSCGSPQTPALYAVIPKAWVAAQAFGGEVDYGGRGDPISNRRDEEYFRDR